MVGRFHDDEPRGRRVDRAADGGPMRRHAPAIERPPYAYVPGHGLPHPVNDPAGHLHAARVSAHEPPISPAELAALPPAPESRRQALAVVLSGHPDWLFAVDLFNEGFCWEAHEAWEAFWHALGRVTPEARFVQGLIHLAAACVKIREGRPRGVGNHARRARSLLAEAIADAPAGRGGDAGSSRPDAPVPGTGGTRDHGCAALGLAPESIVAVLAELEAYRPECWHTARVPVVKVLTADLRIVRCAESSSAGRTTGRT